MKVKKRQNKSVKMTLMLWSVLPLLLLAFTSVGINMYYKRVHQKETISKQTESMRYAAAYIDNSINEFLQSTYFLSYNDTFSQFLSLRDSSYEIPQYQISVITDTLSRLKNTSNFISDIAVYNREIDRVITSSSYYEAHAFFSFHFSYEKYPYDYWKNYRQEASCSMLKASSYKKGYNDTRESGVPVVITDIGGISSNCLFIATISETEFNRIFATYKATPETQFLMFGEDEEPYFHNTLAHKLKDNQKLIKNIKKDQQIFNDTLENKDYLILSLKPQFTYFKNCFLLTALPKNEINHYINMVQLWSMLCLLGVLAITLVIAVKKTQNFYSPFEDVLHIINPNYTVSNENEFEYLKKYFTAAQRHHNKLTSDLHALLPIACEQQFLKVVRGDKDVDTDTLIQSLAKNGVRFNAPYYQAAIIDLYYKPTYYDQFSKEQDSIIRIGLRDSIKGCFPPEIEVYLLESGNNELCLIANLTSELQEAAVIHALNSLIDALYADRDYLSLCIGLGGIYAEMFQLSKSYHEAQNAVTGMTGLGESTIRVYESKPLSIGYTYSTEQERANYNYLLTGNFEGAKQIYSDIIHANQEKQITAENMRALIFRLYITGIDVLNQKGQNEKELLASEYIDMQQGFASYSNQEAIEYTLKFYKAIARCTVKNSKINLMQVVEYINQNYNQDIYLEQIAEMFQTSSKYLSRIIKEGLGVGFHQYLSKVRIDNAKKLLLSTSLTIREVAEQTGFNNQNTFLRMFDKLEGLTPTQYRQLHK